MSDLNYRDGQIGPFLLVDPARNNYEFSVLIRYPLGAPLPRPLVVWHHGGNPDANGALQSQTWGTTLAQTGYIVIHPSRAPISDIAPLQAECTANRIELTECAYWTAQHRYGAQSTHYLLNNRATIEALHPLLPGAIDWGKVIVGGHSGGSSSVLANAGAWQQWAPNTGPYSERNDTPIAFLASGVQGPDYAGFGSGFQSPGLLPGIRQHSFAPIERPFMFITGVGDETGEPPETRVTAFLTSVPGNKILLWDTAPQAVHNTIGLAKCDTPLRAAHCRWIGSAATAFLDAVVRRRPEAEDWLGSSAFKVLTGTAIEMHQR